MLEKVMYLDLLRSHILELRVRIIPCICLLLNFVNKLYPISNKTTQILYKKCVFLLSLVIKKNPKKLQQNPDETDLGFFVVFSLVWATYDPHWLKF